MRRLITLSCWNVNVLYLLLIRETERCWWALLNAITWIDCKLTIIQFWQYIRMIFITLIKWLILYVILSCYFWFCFFGFAFAVSWNPTFYSGHSCIVHLILFKASFLVCPLQPSSICHFGFFSQAQICYIKVWLNLSLFTIYQVARHYNYWGHHQEYMTNYIHWDCWYKSWENKPKYCNSILESGKLI